MLQREEEPESAGTLAIGVIKKRSVGGYQVSCMVRSTTPDTLLVVGCVVLRLPDVMVDDGGGERLSCHFSDPMRFKHGIHNGFGFGFGFGTGVGIGSGK